MQKAQKPKTKAINPVVAIVVIIAFIIIAVIVGTWAMRGRYEPREHSAQELLPPPGFKGFGGRSGAVTNTRVPARRAPAVRAPFADQVLQGGRSK